MGNQAAKSYFIISRIHKEAGDMEKGFEVVQKGRKEHPGYRKLVLEELDYFLRMGKYKEAREKLEKAVKEDPKNAPLHFSLGSVYDQLYQKSDTNGAEMGGKDSSLFQKAATHYRKALEIDSSFYRPYYNLGALYYNRGADVRNAAMSLKGQAKYEEELQAAKADLKKAEPYLKQALDIKPNDPNTLNALRKVYAELGNKEKAKALEERLNN